MQIGIDSFAAAISDPATGLTLSPVERIPVPRQKHRRNNVTGAKIRGRPEFWRTTTSTEANKSASVELFEALSPFGRKTRYP